MTKVKILEKQSKNVKKVLSRFNVQGYIVQENTYKAEGELRIITINECNEQGKPVKSTTNSKDELLGYSIFEYDENGRLSEIKRYDSKDVSDETYTYTYDKLGNWITKYETMHLINTKFKTENTYQNGLLVEQKNYKNDNFLSNFRFYHDDTGKTIKTKHFSIDGELFLSNVVKERNNQGEAKRVVTLSPSGKILVELTAQFKYDKQRNITKIISFQNGKRTFEKKYKIHLLLKL